MPELPEVETIRRGLERHVPGLRITRVEGQPVLMRRPLDPGQLRLEMLGRRLRTPRRRGKYLLLDCGPNGSLLVHLGMSGRLLLVDERAPLQEHTHLALRFDNGRELRLVDPRRFGFAQWLAKDQEDDDRSLSTLGIEPLDARLRQLLPSMIRSRRAAVKTLLLDQRLVAGIGNIYGAEALWRTRVRPSRPGKDISVARLQRLASEIQAVLEEAIAQGGTTIRDFARLDGDVGSFAVRLQVYGKAGQPCPSCGTTLRNTVLAGRPTVWCVNCQR